MIGITRRILDGILLQQNKKALTHEALSTLMAEVSAVINSRPITTISSDPESPIIHDFVQIILPTTVQVP
jgi:hypothetical protein